MSSPTRTSSAPPVRAAAATDLVSSPTSPLGADLSDEATVRRATSTVGTQADPAPVAPATSPLGKPGVVWGLVAGVVLLLGLVAFLVMRPKTGDPVAAPTPSATVSMPGDDSAIGDGVFDQPVVDANSEAGSVTFAWTYPNRSKKDTYRVSYGPTASDAGNPSRARTVSVTVPRYTVKAPKGTKVCATVVVVRSGQASPGAQPQCETAR